MSGTDQTRRFASIARDRESRLGDVCALKYELCGKRPPPSAHRCGARGCVETFVGASAVLERWRGREDSWLGREIDGVDALFEAYRDGDEAASTALHDLIDHLGVALSNLVNLYNPQKIVVAGWFGDRVAEEFLSDLRAAVRRSSLPQPGAEVVVERSTLGRQATALGAATLPLDRFIEHGWLQ